jgi:hypothetical protein
MESKVLKIRHWVATVVVLVAPSFRKVTKIGQVIRYLAPQALRLQSPRTRCL